jgi:hypothetical protein
MSIKNLKSNAQEIQEIRPLWHGSVNHYIRHIHQWRSKKFAKDHLTLKTPCHPKKRRLCVSGSVRENF